MEETLAAITLLATDKDIIATIDLIHIIFDVLDNKYLESVIIAAPFYIKTWLHLPQ
jgi:hypothetical protein